MSTKMTNPRPVFRNNERNSRSLSASPHISRNNTPSEMYYSDEDSHKGSRPSLNRQSSLAEMVRFKKSYSQPNLTDNDTHKLYSPDSDSFRNNTGFNTSKVYTPIPLITRDNMAYHYLVPRIRSIEGEPRQLTENPNFLYRIGSRVFRATVHDYPERTGPSSSIPKEINVSDDDIVIEEYEEEDDEDEDRYVFHVGRNFNFRDEDSFSCSESEPDGRKEEEETKMSRLWSVVLTDILGFDTERPKSVQDKRAIRERSTGIFDPALAIAIYVAIT